MTIIPKVWIGKKISQFTGKTLFSKSAHNEIVNCLNPLMNPLIRRGETDGVFLSDNNLVLQLARGSGSGSVSGNLNYRGDYDSGLDYAINDLIYTTYSYYGNTHKRVPWVCEIAHGPSGSGAQTPTWPEPATVYWRALAHFLEVREWDVCVPDGLGGTVAKKAYFMSSEPFDP